MPCAAIGDLVPALICRADVATHNELTRWRGHLVLPTAAIESRVLANNQPQSCFLNWCARQMSLVSLTATLMYINVGVEAGRKTLNCFQQFL